jgi:phenylacetate-CoA ligase
MEAAGIGPDDIRVVDELSRMPLLDRATLRSSFVARASIVPPLPVITKTTSGSSGQPVVVQYNAESRHWRDATRWRGYGWGGYEIGMRAFHYWGFVPSRDGTWWSRKKVEFDRALKRDRYVDCTPRSDADLLDVVAQLKQFAPHAIVAYASGAGALARFVNRNGLRTWRDVPVLTGAETLLEGDRAEIAQAFGPAFETYGCREVMLMASECEAHDGLHTSMENLIVEVLVREGDRVRTARPGERGEVAITDLHNLASPLIRYVNGDVAVAGEPGRCNCGRGLTKLRKIEGRTTETLYDGAGHPVGGLVFNILFSTIGHVARSFQVVQRADRSIVFKVVPYVGHDLPAREAQILREHAARYLSGARFEIAVVDEIPLTAAGKRQVVVVEAR